MGIGDLGDRYVWRCGVEFGLDRMDGMENLGVWGYTDSGVCAGSIDGIWMELCVVIWEFEWMALRSLGWVI